MNLSNIMNKLELALDIVGCLAVCSPAIALIVGTIFVNLGGVL